MLCLIMASCISPQATGIISKLAQILFILNVLSASGQAGASQAAEPFQQFRGQEPVTEEWHIEQGTESLHPSLSPWLPLSRRVLGTSANLSNCWFLLIAPASPPPLIRYILLQATAVIRSGNQSWYSWKIISLLFLTHSFPNSQVCDSVPQTEIHHVCAVQLMAEVQGQGLRVI